MMASKFIALLQEAITSHGDHEFVVGYDSAQIEVDFERIGSEEDCTDGFGPRALCFVGRSHHNGRATDRKCFQV